MEKKKDKMMQRKDNEPRISVRPGNFVVPGAQTEPRREEPRDNTPRDGAQKDNAQQGKGGNRNRHRRRDNRRGGNRPQEQQNAEARRQQAPAPRDGGKKHGAPQQEPPQKRQEPQKQHNQKRDRRGGRGEQNPPRRERAEEPRISEAMQRELDAQFASTPAALPTSPVALAEKMLAQSAVDTKEFEVDIATAAYLVEDIPCGFPVPDGKAVEVIGVRFRQAGKVYFFTPAGMRFRIGEAVIVDTARGAEFGEVVLLNRRMAEKDLVQPLRAVLRRATPEDIAHERENRQKESEALKICATRVAHHKLEMKLVDAPYTFDNSKLLFYFTSEGRVDFRELVRDLAGVFRTRIELRQIGIRDEARLIGGLGMCGRPFCCATFLSDFGQVSVKMAKEQGLSINTSKISGCCGRLMCCLRYEQESYAKEAALTPKKDARVTTPEGEGTVVEATPISGLLRVRLDKDAEGAPVVFHRDDVTVLGASAAPKAEEPREKSAEDAKE